VVRLRQGNSKPRAVAVQVAILMTQANSASQAVSHVLAGPGDGDMAREEFRAYTMMLLAVAGTDRRQHVKELPRASPAPRRRDGLGAELVRHGARPGKTPSRPARRRGISAQVRIDSTAPDLDPGDAVGRSRRSSRPTGQARDPRTTIRQHFCQADSPGRFATCQNSRTEGHTRRVPGGLPVPEAAPNIQIRMNQVLSGVEAIQVSQLCGYACASSARGGSGASWAQQTAGGVTAPLVRRDHPAEKQRLASRVGNDGPGGARLDCLVWLRAGDRVR